MRGTKNIYCNMVYIKKLENYYLTLIYNLMKISRELIFFVIVIILLIIGRYDEDFNNKDIKCTHIDSKINTIQELFQNNTNKYHNKVAFIENNHKITFSQYQILCNKLASALLKINYDSKPIVGIRADNNFLYHIGYFGTILTGGVCVSIYNNSTIKLFLKSITENNINILILQNDSILHNIKELPKTVKAILLIEGLKNKKLRKQFSIDILSIDQVIHFGELKYKSYQNKNQVISISYTSGTTGTPKKIKINNNDIINTLQGIMYQLQKFKNRFNPCIIRDSEEKILSYLPLAHISGQLMDIYFPLLIGCEVSFKKRDLINDLKLTKPTIFFATPQIWNSLKDEIEDIKDKKMFSRSLIFSSITNSKIKKEIGLDKCKYFISGSSKLDSNLKLYYRDLFINICEIYGMTEFASIVSIQLPSDNCYNCVGKPLPNIKVKIINNQIYFNKRNKWIKTNDLGNYDKNNNLIINGRIDDMITLSNGSTINPVYIENELKNKIKIAKDIFVFKNNIGTLTCVIVISQHKNTIFINHQLKNILQSINSSVETIYEALEDPKIKNYINKQIKLYNSETSFKNYRISNFILTESNQTSNRLSYKKLLNIFNGNST
tara:strand:- start:37989 stop:39812 length:1824 start_codon:yes stop_codon:yes gene_type:complete